MNIKMLKVDVDILMTAVRMLNATEAQAVLRAFGLAEEGGECCPSCGTPSPRYRLVLERVEAEG